jgi:Zn-dependent M28 family amino/carboxypeptidase
MRWIRRVSLIALVTVMALGLLAPSAVAVKPLLPNEMGVRAYQYVDALSNISPKRVAATAGEVAAAELVKGWFADSGYEAEYQPFSYVRRGVTYQSQNVVAYSPAPLKPKSSPAPLVIIGAHYDAVAAGEGADDNASGVAVMLEIAERIEKFPRKYDIVFVAFGAEEVGLRGSAYYVSQMSEEDKARTVAMINFDSLIVGDKLYIHAGSNGLTGPRDDMLRLITLMKLPIEIQPGLNPAYPAGITPNGFSDYTAFNQAGIPVVAFESTNWEIDDLDGYTQTEEFGSFWHTSKDDLEIIETLLPGRPMVRLAAYTELVFTYLKLLNL